MSEAASHHGPDRPSAGRQEPDDARTLALAAEASLVRARLAYQERYLDINSMLSAVDGTLLVLATQRDHLPACEVDRLTVALRAEVQSLRNLLGGEPENPPRRTSDA